MQGRLQEHSKHSSNTRVGWKVHRLTKKELCHSNETRHALNSTFPDTCCVVFFQINPHWISNSELWKVVLATFHNGLENWRRESCFIRTMLLHTGLWLLYVTVALNWLITLHILLIWHHLTIHHHEKTLGWVMTKSYLQLRIFVFKDQEESFNTTGIQALQHRWKKEDCFHTREDSKLQRRVVIANFELPSVHTWEKTAEFAV